MPLLFLLFCPRAVAVVGAEDTFPLRILFVVVFISGGGGGSGVVVVVVVDRVTPRLADGGVESDGGR